MTAPVHGFGTFDGDKFPTEILTQLQSALGRAPTAIEGALWSRIRAMSPVGSSRTLSRGGFLPGTVNEESTATPQASDAGIDLGNGTTWVVRHQAIELTPNGTPRMHPGAIAAGALAEVSAAGARPVAFLHSLRLGDLTYPETRTLLASAVAGMAEVANRCGAPGIGGSLGLDTAHPDASLLHTACFGVASTESLSPAVPIAAGSPVLYAGAPRAFLGSVPVQGGDSFLASRLIEAALELRSKGLTAGIQSVGQTGLGLAAGSLAARTQVGIAIDTAMVPGPLPADTRLDSILSPSTDGMLIVVRTGSESEALQILQKWELAHAQVGTVTEVPHLRIQQGPEDLVDLPVATLIEPFPAHATTTDDVAPAAATVSGVGIDTIRDDSRPMEDLMRMLAWPLIASRNWIDGQFDQTVGNGSVVCPGADAAVIRVSPNPRRSPSPASEPSEPSAPQDRFLAITSDGNGTYVGLSPVVGSQLAVVEAARNLACMGALPLAATAFLCSPARPTPESTQATEACVRGIEQACLAFATPRTRDHFLLHHLPTTGAQANASVMVTMTGHVERQEYITTPWFKHDGDAILLLGDPTDPADPWSGLGGSAYLEVIHGKRVGPPPRCDLATAKTLHTALVGLIQSGGILSAHDCSRGGLAVALAECCICGRDGYRAPRWMGATLDLSPFLPEGARVDALLFGETQSRVVVSCAALDVGKVLERAKILGVPAARIGTVGGEQLVIRLGEREHIAPVQSLYDHWWHAISIAMQ